MAGGDRSSNRGRWGSLHSKEYSKRSNVDHAATYINPAVDIICPVGFVPWGWEDFAGLEPISGTCGEERLAALWLVCGPGGSTAS